MCGQAMHALCLADVALCVPAQDAAKHVRCLAPYLKVAPLAPGQRSPDKDRREAECLLCKLVRHTASPAWKSARLRQTLKAKSGGRCSRGDTTLPGSSKQCRL